MLISVDFHIPGARVLGMEVDKNNIQIMEGNEDPHCEYLMPSHMHLPHWDSHGAGAGSKP